jgi:hypothetical protein
MRGRRQEPNPKQRSHREIAASILMMEAFSLSGIPPGDFKSGRKLMKLPAYYTQFLACCEGQHGNCSHIDSEGNVIWVCGCSCHPRVILNHADLDLMPEAVARREVVATSA